MILPKLVLSASLLVGYTGLASAQALCATYLCLNNTPGQVPSQCAPLRAPYFAIQVWSPAFNPPATAAARQTWLVAGCPTADPRYIANITKTYGRLPTDPGT